MKRSRGFALVVVLWGMALLMLMAQVMLSGTLVSRRLSSELVQRSQLNSLAEAGIVRGVVGLLDRQHSRGWRVDGKLYDFSFAGLHIRVSIQDENGKIDLNAADGATLSSLFVAAGLDRQAAQSLADKVMDWRESGDAKHLNGAKREDYRAAGYTYGPRAAPFQSIDELRLVMGMTDDVFHRVSSSVTIYTGRQYIDPATAPRLALMAIPGMTPEKTQRALADRDTGRTSAGDGGAAIQNGIIAPAISLAGHAFTIRSEIPIEGTDRTFAREEVVRITDDPARPFWILAVRE